MQNAEVENCKEHVCLVEILQSSDCSCSNIWIWKLGYHKIGYT
jgi:hypothetical protein